jgi:acyl-CoA thioester hydrolase
MTFCLRLRVRYAECDAQSIVFNARWGDYVDVAVGEYARAVFGAVDQSLDWRLVKQTSEWRSPARYDDVVEFCVSTVRIGTTSFVLATEASRDGQRLALFETIYVVVDPVAGVKRPIPDAARAALERGAPGVVIDQAGTRIG